MTTDMAAAYEAGIIEGRAEILAILRVPGDLARLLPPTVTEPTLADLEAGIARNRAALRVLCPYNPAEAWTLKQAAAFAGRTEPTVREWIERFAIGRPVVTSIMVSAPSLMMLLDGDLMALSLYLAGDRESMLVEPYMERAGLQVA